MGAETRITSEDIIGHFTSKTEMALGRGELLKIVSERIAEDDPATSRVLATIADDIIAECHAALDDLNVMSQVMANDPSCGGLPISSSAKKNTNDAMRCLFSMGQ
jgi:hypothetical protein